MQKGHGSFRSRSNRWTMLLALVLCIAVALQGCAGTNRTPPVKPVFPLVSNSPANISVIPEQLSPTTNLELFADTKGKGAASGAGVAMGQWLSAGAGGREAGVLFILTLPLAGVYGAIKGSRTAEREKDSLPAARSALQQQDIQQLLAAKVIDYARQEGWPEAGLSPGAVPGQAGELPDTHGTPGSGSYGLEVAITHVGAPRSGIDDPVHLDVWTRSRIIDPVTGEAGATRNYNIKFGKLTFSEWMKDDAKAFRVGLEEALNAFAERMLDEAFLIVPDRDLWPERDQVGRVGPPLGPLPVSPEKNRGVVASSAWGPTLSWAPLPARIRGAGPESGQIRNVTWEIRIGEIENGVVRRLIYRRSGLKETLHHISAQLQEGGTYSWSVRAHFELDGRQRVTEWAAVPGSLTNDPLIPNVNSYVFRMPRW